VGPLDLLQERDRLLQADIARKFLRSILEHEEVAPLLSDHGQKRCNDMHAATSDPEARLFRKGPGKEARLSYMGHAMTENRHGPHGGLRSCARRSPSLNGINP
jgi:hypothetical protein